MLEPTEAQKCQLSFPRPPSWQVAGPGVDPGTRAWKEPGLGGLTTGFMDDFGPATHPDLSVFN